LVTGILGVTSRSVTPALLEYLRASGAERAASGPPLDRGDSGDRGDGGDEHRTPATRDDAAACAAGMVLVSGDYCPDVVQTCAQWLDPPPYQNLRCARFEPSKCQTPRVGMRYCIDKHEHTEPGETLPTVSISFVDAKLACAREGKHLCREDEWQFACEGEEMRPYPYGFVRDASLCNFDQTNLGRNSKELRDLRSSIQDHPNCLSPFGVHNMVGNVDEWVEAEGYQRSVLHGGWWLPGRNRCRATTREHGPEYQGKQVGYRCCSAAR
jgi:formylglycine-generating enzyme required for sulfatase activity